MSSNRLSRLLAPLEGGRLALFTHLYPLHGFGLDPTWPLKADDPTEATEVIAVFPGVIADDLRVHLTRIGGMFVPVREELIGVEDRDDAGNAKVADPWTNLDDPKLRFEQAAVDSMNLVICELAMFGLQTEPASIGELGAGSLTSEYARVTGGGGPYMERTVGPLLALGRDPILTVLRPTPENLTARVISLSRARRLYEIAPSLPNFVAAAYSLYGRRLLPECLTNSWIAVELMLGWLWRHEYAINARSRSHRERLADHRTFSAAVIAEVLYANGCLPADVYDLVQLARKHRNKLMHDGSIETPAIGDALDAMRAMLKFILDEDVARGMRSWSRFF